MNGFDPWTLKAETGNCNPLPEAVRRKCDPKLDSPLGEGFSVPLRTKFMDSSNLGQKHFKQQHNRSNKSDNMVTSEKTEWVSVTPCTFEDRTVIHLLESCPSPWRPFCLEKFESVFVYKYLSGVSRQLS